MNLSAPFIRRPVMTTLIMLAILIAGFVAFERLPVSDLPNIEHPKISIHAQYSGATPETMVKLITTPLEKELMNVKGVKEISSRSSKGISSITLDFDLNKNLDEAAREVQAALNLADSALPSDMEKKPMYFKKDAGQEHEIYLILTSSSASTAELREYGDIYISPRLSRIEGVASVDSFGPPYAIKINLNPELLASRHVGLDEVISAIRRYNSDMPLGSIKTGTRTISLELSGKITEAKDFENIVVAKGPVYLKDVGMIENSSDSNYEFHYLKEGAKYPALIIGIKKISGANTVAISKEVNRIFPEIKRDLPTSVSLSIWFDKAVWIEESILDVEWSLLFAFLLVVLVIFISLGRITDALIPSVALPMSLIGTFIAMYLLQFSLDILSLLALTLSVGFVVDDAIVVLENIVRYNEKGEKPLEASLKGSKEIAFTILAMTLSLVAVFIPILFMGGMHGKLFHEFSVTLAIAIMVSGFISLTLTPLLCSRLLRGIHRETKMQAWTHRLNSKLLNSYGSSLKWCFRHPKTILLFALVCFGACVPLFQKLPVELFPQEDRGMVFSIVNLPKGTSDDKAKNYQVKIEKLFQQNPYVESLLDFSSEDSQIYLANLIQKEKRPPQQKIIQNLQAGIESVPGTQAYTMGWQLINLGLDLAHGGNFKYVLKGVNLNEVEHAAEMLKGRLKGKSAFSYVDLSVSHDEPKLLVKVKEEQAQKYGFASKDIQSLLQQAFSGSGVGNLYKNGNQYKIYVQLAEEYRRSPSSLSKLHLKAPDGSLIPLKSLASWEETLATPTIHRIDQLPAVSVHFALKAGMPANEGFELLKQIASKTLPETVSGKFTGTAEMTENTLRDTLLLLLASALVMYLVLGMLYESFVHPLTILSSLPFAGLGGVLTLILFKEPLSLFSIMGFLLLIGIVKKNGIMMIDFALEAMKKENMTAEQAIYAGCLTRFRPIMMTTFAAIMGAIPIAIGFGDSGEARKGLGLVIAGGLVFSQMLTLYVTPVIYLMFEKVAARLSRQRLRTAPSR